MAAAAFVIKTWTASEHSSADGVYVDISGRAGGLIAWILNLLGISPTVRMMVTEDKITFQEGSLEGTWNYITPLENTCSMFYAYKRPLKEAIVLGVILGLATFFTFGILGVALAILYYVLNKRLTVGFTDVGGRMSQIPFKRSVIEGQIIDEVQAARVCSIIQHLVDARRNKSEAALQLP